MYKLNDPAITNYPGENSVNVIHFPQTRIRNIPYPNLHFEMES